MDGFPSAPEALLVVAAVLAAVSVLLLLADRLDVDRRSGERPSDRSENQQPE